MEKMHQVQATSIKHRRYILEIKLYRQRIKRILYNLGPKPCLSGNDGALSSQKSGY